jgi:hypothetical protein
MCLMLFISCLPTRIASHTLIASHHILLHTMVSILLLYSHTRRFSILLPLVRPSVIATTTRTFTSPPSTSADPQLVFSTSELDGIHARLRVLARRKIKSPPKTVAKKYAHTRVVTSITSRCINSDLALLQIRCGVSTTVQLPRKCGDSVHQTDRCMLHAHARMRDININIGININESSE